MQPSDLYCIDATFHLYGSVTAVLILNNYKQKWTTKWFIHGPKCRAENHSFSMKSKKKTKKHPVQDTSARKGQATKEAPPPSIAYPNQVYV